MHIEIGMEVPHTMEHQESVVMRQFKVYPEDQAWINEIGFCRRHLVQQQPKEDQRVVNLTERHQHLQSRNF